jgi:hypothetical protein
MTRSLAQTQMTPATEMQEMTDVVSTGTSSRRRMLRLLAGGALTTALVGIGHEPAAAKKKGKKGKTKGKKRGSTSTGAGSGSSSPTTTPPDRQFPFQPPTGSAPKPSGPPPMMLGAASQAGDVHAAGYYSPSWDHWSQRYLWIDSDAYAGDPAYDDYGTEVGQWFYGVIYDGVQYVSGWYIYTTFYSFGAPGDMYLWSTHWFWVPDQWGGGEWFPYL